MPECAGSNLIIARNHGDVLEMAGSVWADPEPTRPVAIVSLHVGMQGRLRSHCGRVCLADLFTSEAQDRREALESDQEERRRTQEAKAEHLRMVREAEHVQQLLRETQAAASAARAASEAAVARERQRTAAERQRTARHSAYVQGCLAALSAKGPGARC